MAQADLEILIAERSAEEYGVTLRFRHPAGGQGNSLTGRWTLDEAALRAREVDPTAYGETLAAQVFAQPDVRAFVDQALVAAASQETPLHLRLSISPEVQRLHALRWETLRLPGRAAAMAMGERVRFSRYLHSDDWRRVTRPQRDALRALVAIASPDVTGTTLAPVRTDEELQRARAGLGEIRAVELATRGQVTLANLMAHARDGCDILYLVAHGMIVDDEPQVLLERADGGRAWKSGRELAARLGELSQPPILVVLVSCQSAGTGEQDGGALAALGPRLAAAGVPAVVAMQGKVSMDTAAAFIPVFLAELRRDGQVDRAMAVARGAVRERSDWWMPVLFTRLEDGRLFELSKAGPLDDLPPLEIEDAERETKKLKTEPAPLDQPQNEVGERFFRKIQSPLREANVLLTYALLGAAILIIGGAILLVMQIPALFPTDRNTSQPTTAITERQAPVDYQPTGVPLGQGESETVTFGSNTLTIKRNPSSRTGTLGQANDRVSITLASDESCSIELERAQCVYVSPFMVTYLGLEEAYLPTRLEFEVRFRPSPPTSCLPCK